MRFPSVSFITFASALVCVVVGSARGQLHSPHDRGQPGDEMIQAYLRAEAERIDARFLEGTKTAEAWMKNRPRLKEEYFYMLGLWPLPGRTPLQPVITRSRPGDGFVVDMVHYQSRPHLYVTGNLYRPASAAAGQRLPAVLYVCGHSNKGRNGNKTAYQSHGIWFARHGYVCLVVDSLQLGEIRAIHHGTYREGRWWWHSRGYTPAGVECWNGVRGIDYLISRPDVDPERIAVTGISGGGAATYWVAAADDRVKVAVPVSGMADLMSYVPNRTVNGHCDCMFLYNAFRWPWTQIAALIAPRPMLFVNSDRDPIFPMDANDRIICRLERLYSLFGTGDVVDAVVSIGGHAYRKDIRQAAFRFINTHLKNDPAVVTDSEVDLVKDEDEDEDEKYPVPPEQLRVFPQDSDIPGDELNTRIDQHFVAMAEVKAPAIGEFESWKQGLVAELRRVSFGGFPERIPEAKPVESLSSDRVRLTSEPGITFSVAPASDTSISKAKRIVLIVANDGDAAGLPAWAKTVVEPDDAVYVCEPRGVGGTRWTRKNPPNYVERSLPLLGQTADTGRVRDVAAAARYLRTEAQGRVPVEVTGKGAGAILGAYAALWEPDIAGVTAIEPMVSHMDPAAPQFLNVLRVCDIPDTLGMLAPRPLRVVGGKAEGLSRIASIYEAAGAKDKFARQ